MRLLFINNIIQHTYNVLPRRNTLRILRSYPPITTEYTKNVTIAMIMLRSELVRKVWIRLWSPMRCIMSPTIFESKNDMGRRISFAKKSDIREMLTRVFICSVNQLRINSLAICPRVSTTCAIRMIATKFKSPFPIPTSMTDWVRNGSIRLMILPVSIARDSCMMNLL